MSYFYVRSGSQTYSIRLLPDQGGTGPKVQKDGIAWKICLTEENSSSASPVKIKTPQGVKAFELGPTHTIIVTGGGGGTITPHDYYTYVGHGSTPSFAITAYPCYIISEITATVNGNTTHVYPASSSYTYTFPAVYSDGSITVSFDVASSDHAPIFLMSGIDNSISITEDGTTQYTATNIGNVVACVSSNQPHTFYAQPTAFSVTAQVDVSFYRWVIYTDSNPQPSYLYSNPMAIKPTETTYVVAMYQNGGYSTYYASASAGSNGTITPSGTVACNGGPVTFYMTPNSGYHLADLLLNGNSIMSGVSNNQYTFSDVNFTATLYASFSDQYTIAPSAETGGSISPASTVTIAPGGSQTFTITPSSNHNISDVTVDGVSQGAITSYTFSNVQGYHTITASFISNCLPCEVSCQTTCQVSCQSCEVCVSCQTLESCPEGYYTCQGCETCQPCYSCQSACELACQNCQTTCEISCQTGCEVSCQTGCEVACQTGCEVSCQTGCQVACQDTCQLSCQTGCQVSCQSCNTCQTTCELSCQTGCQVACQTGCQVSCQTGCEVSCQTGCQVSCQTGCEVTCQTGCQVSCQTGCQVSCQTGCEVSCQSCVTCVSCETIQYCPEGYYTCQGCETCQPCYSCQSACELACQSCVTCQNCQSGCEVSCQGCQTCVSCETLEWCPAGYYECQWCETCQPSYT